ncbi:hypothetical protein [Brevibacterium senegalense]|uniref:hypothetical protein n=1 Tax=Brevibacterium senegalense TaxID=1033736 RepID=UPI0002DF5921|nr:hypothetical protein [Brevibacterium senegalense]
MGTQDDRLREALAATDPSQRLRETLTHTLLDLIVDCHNDVDAAEGLGLLTAAEVERTSPADPDTARVLTYPAHRLDGATQA